MLWLSSIPGVGWQIVKRVCLLRVPNRLVRWFDVAGVRQRRVWVAQSPLLGQSVLLGQELACDYDVQCQFLFRRSE